MKTQVYKLSGEVAGEIDLPDAIFARKWNPDLVHQALMAQASNRRNVIAHAKGRGEVSGGGKKPWRQKGTGRARHGSIRSPIWKGGGVTHGPTKERIFQKKVNKKMRHAAIVTAISKKLADQELKIVDSFNVGAAKTRNLDAALKVFLKKPKDSKKISALLIPGKDNKLVFRISANIPSVKALRPNSLSVEDILKHKNLLLEQSAVGELR
ncbi:MAG TPA: 50S ribosomal protein L4 [Candidatus Paceibacterota bacterium]